MTLLDPTYELTHSPKVPMTPEQLDAFRPQTPVAGAPRTARQIAYASGIAEIEGVVLRIEALERELAELKSAPRKK